MSDNLNPQQFAYHVAPKTRKAKILKQGLRTDMRPQDWEASFMESGVKRRTQPLGKVYLSPEKSHAHLWGTQIENVNPKQEPIEMSLFKVNTKGLRLEKNKTDIKTTELTSSKPIPPERIEHVEDFYPNYNEYLKNQTNE